MTDRSELWPERRRGLLARATAVAAAPVAAHDGLAVTSASPGFGGVLGRLLEERHVERRERGRAFLAAAQTPPDPRVWDRVERSLESRLLVHQAIMVHLSPVLLLATPTHLPQPYRNGASEVLLGMDLGLDADELVMESAAPGGRPGDDPKSVLHIGPLDLEPGFEQNRYCQLRCEGAESGVAADIVRMLLRT